MCGGGGVLDMAKVICSKSTSLKMHDRSYCSKERQDNWGHPAIGENTVEIFNITISAFFADQDLSPFFCALLTFLHSQNPHNTFLRYLFIYLAQHCVCMSLMCLRLFRLGYTQEDWVWYCKNVVYPLWCVKGRLTTAAVNFKVSSCEVV